MTYIVDTESQERSRAVTAGDTSSPDQREDLHQQKKLTKLEEKEKRLAGTYGLDSSDGIDSVVVFQEAERRSHPGWKRLRIARITIPVLFRKNDAEDMHKLYHLRRDNAGIRRQSFISKSAAFLPGTPHRVDASRFWAVLIGIDAYYEGTILRGCVSDALSMKRFFVNDLGVPKERIQCLLGSRSPVPEDALTPSRANIVNTLYSLIHNREIQLGDNIIIYYAGHGSSYQCSNHSASTVELECSRDVCPVEALCPIDRDTKDADGRWIPDISDRELNALFAQISFAKGYKITFIADCCHAGGMSRTPETGTGRRSILSAAHTTVNDMFRAADERLKDSPGYLSVRSRNWEPYMGSHVVLAACNGYQYATETMGKKGFYRGVHTKALVDVLSSGAWKRETTYVELAKLLNRSCCQTPVVAGDHRYERLWYQSI